VALVRQRVVLVEVGRTPMFVTHSNDRAKLSKREVVTYTPPPGWSSFAGSM
jgi:hypothetical protein